jgi:hypothetical protein
VGWTSAKTSFKVADNSRAYPTTRSLGSHNFARDVKIQLPADKKSPSEMSGDFYLITWIAERERLISLCTEVPFGPS